MLSRFEPRRRVGVWTLIFDKEPPGHGVIRDRWYVATVPPGDGPRHVLGPYYKGTAEAVFEALVKVAEENAA